MEAPSVVPISDSPTHFGVNPIAWLRTLNRVFGFKLLWMLFCSQHVLKGFVMAYTATAADFLFRTYELEGPQLQIYKAIMGLPWALKPIIGVVSDTLPILGYKKAPYIMIVTVFAMFGFGYVAVSPDKSSLPVILCGLICGTLQSSLVDLLTEAKYSERMRAHTEYGPDLVTFVWSGVTLGGLLATSTVGVLLQYCGGPKTVYAVCAVAASVIFIPTSLGYLEEERMSVSEATAHTAKMIRRQPEIIFLSILMAISVITMGIVGVTYQDITINFGLALFFGIVVISSFAILLRPLISLMTVFAFVQTSCALSIEGATFYFFTDNETQYPNGPHFSAFFYTTVIGLIVGVFGLAGLWSYNRFMKEWTYRSIYFFANLAVTVLNLVGLVLYTRTNLDWGIPDKVFVLCGSVMQSLVLTWMWIPGIVMLAHLCPKGLEASMYALLAGCHNIGSSVAQYSGAYMLSELGITPNGSIDESTKFDLLWQAVLIAAILPLFSLIFLPFCIPNKTQTDTILTEHPHSATVGSPWEQVRTYWGQKVVILDDPDNDDPEVAGKEPIRNTPEEISPLINRR